VYQRGIAIRYAAAMRLQGTSRAQASATLLRDLLAGASSPDERRETAVALAQLLLAAGGYEAIPEVLADWDKNDPHEAYVEQGWVLLIHAAVRRGSASEGRHLYSRWKGQMGQDKILPLDQDVVSAMAF
jgi:hypothetical protein